mgnify:CR=1 FL=1
MNQFRQLIIGMNNLISIHIRDTCNRDFVWPDIMTTLLTDKDLLN